MSDPRDDDVPSVDQAQGLVAELGRAVEKLSPAAAVALRGEIVRLAETMLDRALGAALAGSVRKVEVADVVEIEEAQAILRRKSSWIYHEWKRLRLGYRDGGRLLFRRVDLERYMANRQRTR